ncbi:hypothetical protein GEV02_09295 [Rugamonas sp. FT29W]|uniref:Uncharacterized protein n=3 Tax=Telluria group TaxID=2895353 RepID=A0A843SJD1_9BURK|nr:hypothetical protein [Rugamonas rivuli]MQA38342.1 hypothetical protein [Rugamonas aquatica]
MQCYNMSTIISFVQNFSLVAAGELALASGAVCALIVLFKPLLRGLGRAAMLVVKPKRSKEEQLQRRQMRDAMMLKRMLNSVEPSQAAELRAMAARA